MFGVVPVAGDGDCLFHALAYLDHRDGGALRHEVAEFMEAEACNQVGFEGAWLDEAEELYQGTWGGHTAITAYSLLKQARVEIHTRRPDGTVEVTDASHENVRGNLRLPVRRVLYSNQNHYDALVELADGHRDWQPAWNQSARARYFKEVAKTEDFPSLSVAAATAAANNKKGFNQPRPIRKQGQKPKGAQQQTTQTPDAKQAAAPAPPQPHPVLRRLRGKQAPPPELQDDIFTELDRIPVLAKTAHPHRKQEDMIKDPLPKKNDDNNYCRWYYKPVQA